MKVLNVLFSSAIILLVFSTYVSAYDKPAEDKAMKINNNVNFAAKYAAGLSFSEYGVCVHASIKNSLLWVQMDNMDETVQVLWTLVGFGLERFYQETLSINVMAGEQIISTSIKGAKYTFDSNPSAAFEMCLGKVGPALK